MKYVLPTALLLVISAVAVEIPFDPRRGLVEVEVLLDGRVRGSFGIDTGADGIYIDRGFARKNKLTFVGGTRERGVVGLQGRSEAETVKLRSLQVGDERLYNLKPVAIDMGALISDRSIGHPDGLLGYDALRRFYITVDYPRRQLTMRMEEPDFLQDRAFVAIPFSVKGHLALVDVTFNEEVTRPMILDYCASHTSISPGLARRLASLA